MTETDATVARLHHCLVEALNARGPDALNRAVTVAEIYQDLVPYRVVRSTLNIELNADYEHALLRLLAGEGKHVRLEPATAREELRRELASPDPYVGLYRNFAACDVWVSAPDRSAAATSAPAGAPAASGPAPTGPAPQAAARSPAPAPRSAAAPPAAPSVAPRPPAARPAPRAGPAAAPAAPTPTRACPFCGGALPARSDVQYCPFCGKDQRQRPCARCGVVLQRDWRFCVACGAPAGPPSRPA